MAEKIDGIFHETKQIEAGTMGTKRSHDASHDLHYYAKSNEKDEVILYYLKPDGSATALEVDKLPRAEFNKRFKPTPDEKFAPKSEEQKKKEEAEAKVAIAEKHVEKEEHNAAAFEYGQAIKKDGKNLKAHLGKGKAHMALGDVEKAKESFQNLSEIDSLYDKDNKHVFNEYGIQLRRGKMYDLAIDNYNKAIAIDPDDEALYFNAGRAYYEADMQKEAVEHLEKAMALKSDFEEARLLHAAISKKGV